MRSLLIFIATFLLKMAVAFAAATPHDQKQSHMDAIVPKGRAVQIAKTRAKEHPDFEDPHFESVQQQAGTGNWVVKVLSFDENKNKKEGAMYQYIVIDKSTGKILDVMPGGGS